MRPRSSSASSATRPWRVRIAAESSAPVTSIDVVDHDTVRLNLSAPFAPLLAVLTDRAGMIVSPKAAKAEGEKFGAHPVCAGPFKFVESRGAGPHHVRALRQLLEQGRDPLRQGLLRAHRRFAGAPREPQEPASSISSSASIPRTWRASRPTAGSRSSKIVEIGYQGITINLAKSDLAQKNPRGQGSARA